MHVCMYNHLQHSTFLGILTSDVLTLGAEATFTEPAKSTNNRK